MKVIIWGSRGSLPASITAKDVRQKIYKALEAGEGHKFGTRSSLKKFVEKQLPFSIAGIFGSNTSCVQAELPEEYLLFDAGTGLRDFGQKITGLEKKPRHFHIIMSHLHWDHIQGFPFFIPAFTPGNRIDIYGCHPEMEKAFRTQQEKPFFPVPFKHLAANIQFTILKPGKQYNIAGCRIKAIEQNHPGKSYTYSLERNKKKIIYSPDVEHGKDFDNDNYPFVNFCKNADLILFDAQYSFADSITSKENWGHSNNRTGVELAIRSGVKHLCLFHSEPTCDDKSLERILKETTRYASFHTEKQSLKVSIAFDGLEIKV